MHARFSDDAEADLAAISAYIAERNPRAAESVMEAIAASVRHLESFPLLGRPGRAPGVRELVTPGLPYIIFYSLPDEYHVEIERVMHGARMWPPEDEQ